MQEASFEDCFKPIDMQTEFIMKKQLEGEEKSMKVVQTRALLEKHEAGKKMQI